jgi:uncharacterized protein YggE
MRVSICLLLASAGLAACSERAADPRGVDRAETLLQVSASGRADTRPDEARFTAGVTSIAATANEATRQNNETMEKVVRGIEALGVGRDDVQTRTISLSRIEYGSNRGRFQAHNIVEVRLRNVERVSQAIAAATSAGANVLSGPNLQVADQESANRSAYQNAYGRPYPIAVEAAAQVAAPPPISAPPEEGPAMRAGLNVSHVQIQVDFALEG